VKYAGEESTSKRARVGSAVAALGADAAVITAPASIAWLFNIRGGDVIRSPLPLSQACCAPTARRACSSTPPR
jgi:Xaa-Pro aminopeptidase